MKNRYLKIFTFVLFTLSQIQFINGQGLSFTYLIPKNGYLAAPISPFSIRGVGIGGMVGLESGFTLYSIPGLPMTGLPFESDKPLTGPSWSVLIPGQLTFSLGKGPVGVKLLGGGFVLYNASSRLNRGNLDRAIAQYENWDIASSKLKMDMKTGFGWMAGAELEFKVSNKFSITTEVQYLSGSSKSELTGTYSGGDVDGTITSKQANFDSAKTSLEGIEISLGVKLGGK